MADECYQHCANTVLSRVQYKSRGLRAGRPSLPESLPAAFKSRRVSAALIFLTSGNNCNFFVKKIATVVCIDFLTWGNNCYFFVTLCSDTAWMIVDLWRKIHRCHRFNLRMWNSRHFLPMCQETNKRRDFNLGHSKRRRLLIRNTIWWNLGFRLIR